MSETNELLQCKRCGKEFRENYCPNCGTIRSLKRINGQYITDSIGSILNLNRGIFYTIKELFIRPGAAVEQFILHDRNRLVKPIVFIIICSLFYTLAHQIFQFEDGYISNGTVENSADIVFNWISSNYGYANILMALFIAMWLKVLFRKHSYNYFEVLVLLCYVIGISMLIFGSLGIVDSLVPVKVVDKGFLLGILYVAWAIGQFFAPKKIFSYVKAFLAYILGLMTFTIVIILSDILIKAII